MSNPRESCRESALTIPTSARSANHIAAKLLPAAVGPQMTRIGALLLSAKATLELGPGELHDRGPPLDVVRRQSRLCERNEEGPHFALREFVTRLDGPLSCDRRRDSFMTRVCRGVAVSGQRRKRFTQTPLRVEAQVWHRHTVHEQRTAAETFHFEPQGGEQRAIGLERFDFRRCEMQRKRRQQALRRRLSALDHAHEPLVKNAL